VVSPSAAPLILITDGWLANAGDAASYIATTRSLQQALPGARVAISAHHRALVGHLYPELDLVPPLDALTGPSWAWTTDEDLAERDVIERVVAEADLVVAAAGGYLLERYKPTGRIRGYEYLLERGKRLAFFSQSVGKFRDPDLGARLRRVLEAAELVLVRDQASLDVVTEQRDAEGVHLTADEAFLFPSLRRIARPRSLMVTPSPHSWERGSDNELPDESFVPEVAAALRRVLSSGLVRTVTLASTAQGLGGPTWALDDDSVVSEEILAAVPAHWRSRITVRRGYLTPWQYAALAAEHTALISMRMYGAILATTARTPAVVANASDKALELRRRTKGGIKGIADRSEIAKLDELVTPLLEDPGPARLRQNASVEQMRTLARANAKLVAEQLQ
jgi:polysaccharide pyruvyl transferase WcaK-like protein